MRASRALTVALAVGAAVGLAAPMAAAGGPPNGGGPTNVDVDPSSVHQGATLRISARGCSQGGRVTSNAFDEVHLSAGDINFATARIHDHTTPGNYNLAVKCNDNDRVATRSFRVLEGRGADGGLGGARRPHRHRDDGRRQPGRRRRDRRCGVRRPPAGAQSYGSDRTNLPERPRRPVAPESRPGLGGDGRVAATVVTSAAAGLPMRRR